MRAFTSSVSALATVAALLAGACGGVPRETQTLTRSVELDTAESVDVDLKMTAGELNVGGGATGLMDASFRFNVPSWEPRIDYKRDGGRGSLLVQQPESSLSFGNSENKWDLRFNDNAPLALTARLGAGEATMTLGTLSLRSLQIDHGAGELMLDLRGAPRRSYDVRVNGGVGTAEIRVPRSVGVVATAAGGLGSIDVRGLEKRGESWYNPAHDNDPVTIRLDVKGGVGEIRISAD